jgi:hypothetical protein
VDRAALAAITTAKGRRRCWYSALNVAKTLLTFQRLGGEFAFANFNNYANTWGQNVMECSKESAYLSPAGQVFELFSRSPAAWPLELEVREPRENVVVQAAWNEARTALYIVILNYTADPVPLEFSTQSLERQFRQCDLTVLRAASLLAYVTPTNTCVVDRADSTGTLTDGAKVELTAPPYSLTQAVLK